MGIFAVVIGHEWQGWSGIKDYFAELIWPTRFTFVVLIMPFYLGFFFLMKLRRPQSFLVAIGALCVVYASAYLRDISSVAPGTALSLGTRPIVIHAAAYLQVMLLGGWLAYRDDGGRSQSRSWVVSLLVALAVYLAAKFLLVTGHWPRAYPVLHGLTFLLCLASFEVLSSRDVTSRLHGTRIIWPAVAFTGGLTLEIYLVHVFIADYWWLWRIRFPLNIALFWAITLPVAFALGSVVRLIQRSLRREPKPTSVNEPLASRILGRASPPAAP
jgi:peptidoglycan/LPS O-acetylase OafA/YrhL